VKSIWERPVREMLKVMDIHTYYGNSYILQGVSLEVEKGSVVALLGRNGAGKTTVMRSIIGFAPPRSGVIQFGGADITGFEPHRIAKMGIALIPQGRRIFPTLTVKDNIAIAAHAHGSSSKRTDLNKILSSFPLLKERLNARGNSLSGGELQMLAIARALISNPALILMDEVSEGLAPFALKEVKRVISQLKAEEGLSILLAEQNLRFALEVADYVYLMNRGKVAYQCKAEELIEDDEIKTRYIGI
jgi:branched-chain amino acid transport system ATP-binding protein